MAPLIVLVLSFALISATFRMLRGDWAVGRSGLAAAASLFVFTGVSHFIFLEAMTEMVPPIFPAPQVWVAVTGVAEIVGGVGLLFERTRPIAAWSLVVFLIAVFPANVYAAFEQVGMGGHRQGVDYLWFRAPLQVVFLAWVLYFGIVRNDGPGTVE